MLRSQSLVLLLAIVGGLVGGGCRTYGGYGSEPKTYKALQTTVQSFANRLEQAKAELHKLEKAAARADTLRPLVNRFRHLVERHRTLLKKQRRRVKRLSLDSDYRVLHRAYGATITERRIMRDKYQQAIQRVRAVVQEMPSTPPSERRIGRQYTVRPIGFPDRTPDEKLTMKQALQGL